MGEDESIGADDFGADVPVGARRATFTPASSEAADTFFGAISPSIPLNAPPPSPSSVQKPPPGSELPAPPRRKSLADQELVTTLVTEAQTSGNSLEAIEKLQQQLLLREQEARAFANWESSMVAIGTPEALDAVEETRTTFTEAIQIVFPAQAALPAAEEPAAPVGPNEPVEPDEPIESEDLIEPAEPIVLLAPSPPTAPDAIPITDAELSKPGVFSRESSAMEPTPLEHRTGRAVRMFWVWFATNSSVISIVLGGILLSLGMSLRQAIVAALTGVALSFLPAGLGTLASKWNGQPTMTVSRASFGHFGNIVPAALSLITRLFCGAVLLWLLATVTARILVGSSLAGGLTELQLAVIVGGGTFLVALVAAFFGFALISRIQLVLSALSAIFIVAFIVVTWPSVDLANALTIGDGPWILVLTGAILVFSFVGLAWSTSGGDLARYQRPSSSGAASMLSASLGSALPVFVLVGYGSLLAASDDALAYGMVVNPIETLSSLVPEWFVAPLIAAIGLGLLSSVMLSIYSGGFALQAMGARLPREAAIIVAALALGAGAIGMMLVAVDLNLVFRDIATTLAVPTAAWVGIFTAEVMIRNRRFDSRSLVDRGGVYTAVNWANLAMLVVATVIGLGLTTASVAWLSWQGYLFGAFGVPLGSDVARTDLGVLVALVLGLLAPIVAGVRAIRRQEADL